MTTALRHIEATTGQRMIIDRCEALGLPLVVTDLSGRIRHRCCGTHDWLGRAVADSAMFAQGLLGVVPQWQGRADVEVTELWPGCSVLPLAIRSHRRVTGYRLVVLMTRDLVAGEQWHQMAHLARVDRVAAETELKGGRLLDSSELTRLCELLKWMAGDLDSRDRRDREMDNLSQQLAEAYEELSLLYTLSANMTVKQAPESFLDETLAELRQVTGLKWMILHLSDGEGQLERVRGRTFIAGRNPSEPGVLTAAARRVLNQTNVGDSARIVADPSSLGVGVPIDGLETVMIVPLVREDRVLGVIVGAEKADGSDLSSIDSKLAESLGQNVSIFLENVVLYDNMQDMFMGTLRTLVSAIDAKDTYTCGHSERVAHVGRQLAEAAGLDADTVERVYLAGLVHDVGKIGIPEAVLSKPGRLTDEEFAIIKTHPRIGARIIQEIRQMADLIPGVLYHHERYDGRGYPDGLAGEDIPLFGRVLCLADSFDAMSSTRTYRAALNREGVLEEVRQCAGTQFDPGLADVFLSLDFSEFDRMLHTHQERTSPLSKELGGKSP